MTKHLNTASKTLFTFLVCLLVAATFTACGSKKNAAKQGVKRQQASRSIRQAKQQNTVIREIAAQQQVPLKPYKWSTRHSRLNSPAVQKHMDSKNCEKRYSKAYCAKVIRRINQSLKQASRKSLEQAKQRSQQ